MSSSSALTAGDTRVHDPGDLRADPVAAVERPLVGAVFCLGAPALKIAILNRVVTSDFCEPGNGELFDIARSAELAGRPLAIAALSADIASHGLGDLAGAVIVAASTVTLAQVPLLSVRLVQEAVYRDGMRETAAFHAKLTTTAEESDHPRDLLRVFEQHSWTLARLARRLKEFS